MKQTSPRCAYYAAWPLAAIGLVAVLAVALTACQNQPAPSTPALYPTVAYPYQPTNSPTSGLGQVTLDDGLASLGSYRATFILTATGSAFTAHALMINEQVHANNTQHTTYIYSDTAQLKNYQNIEQVRLGNSSFLSIHNSDGATSCMAHPLRDQGQADMTPFSYSDLGDLSDAKYVGEETLELPSGALPTRHYMVERSVLSGFSAGRAEVWVAARGGYVAKLQATANGRGPFQAYPDFDGQLVVHYQINHINQSISIQPPAACTGDTPLMAGAEQVTIAGNLIAYQAPTTLEVAVEFYTREMSARGWKTTQEPVTDQGITTLNFERDQTNATVLLMAASQRTIVQVMIILAQTG